ncbi:MAG: hypothetical protein IJD82_00920, partial [Clostridia bacterium]|nr:hypothetical protein [Clostridia bacterium]
MTKQETIYENNRARQFSVFWTKRSCFFVQGAQIRMKKRSRSLGFSCCASVVVLFIAVDDLS